MDTQYYDRLQRMAQTYNPESCVPTPLRGTERTTVYKTGFVMARWALNGLVSIISRVRNIQKVYVKDEELRWHACSESLKSYNSLKGQKRNAFCDWLPFWNIISSVHSGRLGVSYRKFSVQNYSIFYSHCFSFALLFAIIPQNFAVFCLPRKKNEKSAPLFSWVNPRLPFLRYSCVV